jgi:PilZ domain
MTSHTVPRKVYVKSRNAAALTCPSCHRTKIANLTQYTHITSPLKAKCRCGCLFDVPDVVLEARKFYRKKARLPGSYVKTVVDTMGCMTVHEVSMTGLRFHTDKEHDLAVEDVLGVCFVFDDEKHTEMRRTVVIRHIQGRVIGAEFCDRHTYDLDLIHYLLLS